MAEYRRLMKFLKKVETSKMLKLPEYGARATPVNASVSMIYRLFIRNQNMRPKEDILSDPQLYHDDAKKPLTLSSSQLNDHFMKQHNFDPQNVEVQLLYIKRSNSYEDRFAGHVAFPGGKQEIGESLLDAAIRETYEEVGIDLLDKNKFAFVKQYPLTIPFFFMPNNRRMYISPFVFVQLTFEDVDITLQEREVGSSVWTSVEFLANNDPRFFWFRPQRHARYKTNFTLLMPTLCMINGAKYSNEEAYREPTLVDKKFPLGGMTCFI